MSFWSIITLLVIPAASLLCYWRGSTIFFVADDFLWLERASFLIPKGPFTIFKSEGLYFDPSIYLLFRLNYLFGGLEPVWYHLVDLVIHTSNALLVAYLAFLLYQNKKVAFFSGLIFAVSHTNADAVLWPSSRVDTVAALFYLSSIISYIRYQKSNRAGLYCLSGLFYILALSAKSTPVMLPLVILTIEIGSSNKTSYKSIFHRLIPFLLISCIYLILLFHISPQQIIQTPEVLSKLNTKEFLKGISALFFPESLTGQNENLCIGLAVLFFVLTLGLSIFYTSAKSILIPLIMIAVIMTPLIFMPMTYAYATPFNPPSYLLASIYHRIYMAVIGFSVLMGVLISSISQKFEQYGKPVYRLFLGLLIIIIFTYGYLFIKEREQIWRSHGEQYKSHVSVAKAIASQSKNPSHISNLYVINSPSTSFTKSIFRVYLGNPNLNVQYLQEISELPSKRTSSEKDAVLIFKRENQHYKMSFSEL